MLLLICNVYSEIMTVTEFPVVFGATALLVNGVILIEKLFLNGGKR